MPDVGGQDTKEAESCYLDPGGAIGSQQRHWFTKNRCSWVDRCPGHRALCATGLEKPHEAAVVKWGLPRTESKTDMLRLWQDSLRFIFRFFKINHPLLLHP